MFKNRPLEQTSMFPPFRTKAVLMVVVVPPPAEAKTRLPAGFLTTLALQYNQRLPWLTPADTQKQHTGIQTHFWKKKKQINAPA